MFIEKIIYEKNKCTVTADGHEYIADPDCVISHRIRINEEIDENTFAEFLTDSENCLCRKYLYGQIDKYSKTEKGYAAKLKEKGFSYRAINLAIIRAKELGYIDDVGYAERYYEKNKNKKGLSRISKELSAKGVDREDTEFLREKEENLDCVIALGEKFMKKREKTYEEKVKLVRHLAAKGFSMSTVMTAANAIFGQED